MTKKCPFKFFIQLTLIHQNESPYFSPAQKLLRARYKYCNRDSHLIRWNSILNISFNLSPARDPHDTICLYRVSQEEGTKLRESVPYVELYRYNPKHLYPKFNGYGDNGQRKVLTSCISAYCTSSAVAH